MALLDIIMAYDCNLACDYCTITPLMRQRSLPSRAILSALQRGRERGYDEVQFTGGEPTIRGDLLPLVRAARELGYAGVKVQTNGLVFAERSNLDRAVAAGVNRVHISIHTHRADRYDALVRRDGAYPLMVEGLDNCVAADVEFGVDVILKADTIADLPDALRWLHGRGVRHADLWYVSLTDGNRDNVESMPPMTDAMPYVRDALAWADANAMRVRSLHIPRCLLGADAPHAFDPGAGRVMVVTPDATFELADSKLTPNRHVPACEGCEHRDVCPGVRADYLERFGDGEIAGARGQPATIAPATR